MASFSGADDDCGCGNDECDDDPSCRAAAVAAERVAWAERQRFSHHGAVAGSAGASCDTAFAAAASCSEMAGVDASFDSAGLGCEEIACSRQCR